MNKEYTDLKNKYIYPITAKRLVNDKIKHTIGAMYFETPTTRLDYVVTFIRCIKEFIIREINK